MSCTNARGFIPLGLFSPLVIFQSSRLLLLVPSDCRFDALTAPVGTLFNVTVMAENVVDMKTWQVKMRFNDSFINVTRWYEPTWDPTYVFYGKTTLPVPAPPRPAYGLEWLGCGSSMFPAPGPGGGFTGSGLLCIFTFNITAAPRVGEDYSCVLNITNSADTFWIKARESGKRQFDIHENGYYELRSSRLADVNKDGKVDMADISILIDCFMTTPNSPNWNPNADVNKDNIVDMADISIAIDEFMK